MRTHARTYTQASHSIGSKQNCRAVDFDLTITTITKVFPRVRNQKHLSSDHFSAELGFTYVLELVSLGAWSYCSLIMTMQTGIMSMYNIIKE